MRADLICQSDRRGIITTQRIITGTANHHPYDHKIDRPNITTHIDTIINPRTMPIIWIMNFLKIETIKVMGLLSV